MATKRSRGKAAATSYDSSKFVSAAAEKRYEKGMGQKVPIIERGFEIDEGKFSQIDGIIAQRHWRRLCSQPNPAVLPVVREFYANAYEHHAYTAMVRGKPVHFDRSTINRYYGLQDIDPDEYTATIEDHDLDDITNALCVANAAWEVNSSGERVKMSSRSLRPEARVWFHFITRNLLPGSHITYVTKDRMILLHSLLAEETIDVGGVISTNIVRAANSAPAGLFYCSLITGLCAQAKVPMDPREELLPPTTALTATIIQRLLAEKGPAASSSSAHPSSSAQHSRRPRSVAQRLEHLEQAVQEQGSYMTYQTQHNQAMEQMLRLMAGQLHISPDQFPVFPQPPAAATAMDAEDDADDADE